VNKGLKKARPFDRTFLISLFFASRFCLWSIIQNSGLKAKLYSKPFSALLPSFGQNFSAGAGLHSFNKSVAAFASSDLGLISSFHNALSGGHAAK
jgi:putative Ca2+/H+ antiporter (TMEM165/GDT1 family)